MKLHLKKPLVFFDIETTGLNIANDKIIEIALLKVMPDNSIEKKLQRINPEIPIPYTSSLIHGIYDEDVKDMPTFKTIAPELNAFIGNSDLAGYNSNKFDIPLLVEEFLRAGVDFDMSNRKCVDVQVIFHKMEQRTLKAAYKFYCNKDLENAHSAEADINATYEILLAQLERYQEQLKNDIDFLSNLSDYKQNIDIAGRIVLNEKNIPVFNFGKHKGKPVEQVFKEEPSYYSWMMNGDFLMSTKKAITAIKLGSQFKLV